MLYELYKNIFKLARKDREYLYSNFDDIVSSFEAEEDEKVEAKNHVFKTVCASGLHDPETPNEMCKLIELLEKFVKIDENYNHENVSIFINPMYSGAKKVLIRPCKIVGLMRKLDRLSRRLKRQGLEEEEIKEIKKSFHGHLCEIKNRLKSSAK